jgi:hypothetical protein
MTQATVRPTLLTSYNILVITGSVKKDPDKPKTTPVARPIAAIIYFVRSIIDWFRYLIKSNQSYRLEIPENCMDVSWLQAQIKQPFNAQPNEI